MAFIVLFVVFKLKNIPPERLSFGTMFRKLLSIIPIIRFEKRKFEELGEEKVLKEKVPKISGLKRLEGIESRLMREGVNEVETLFREFSRAIKRYFAEIWNLKYRFTFEELGDEIKKRKVGIGLERKMLLMLDKISLVNYASGTLSKKDLKKLLNRSMMIVSELEKGRIKERRRVLESDKKAKVKVGKRVVGMLIENLKRLFAFKGIVRVKQKVGRKVKQRVRQIAKQKTKTLKKGRNAWS